MVADERKYNQMRHRLSPYLAMTSSLLLFQFQIPYVLWSGDPKVHALPLLLLLWCS
ncbi:uncharacterized protein BJX67DRAFT_347272 [Aspergillus lucknowensis]|uniref:Uncharacterized protein n=1 Tax=Aspergillus lucknowensis TaxID=176173 RepID=A0ABR4LZM0_9EURO